MRILYLEDDPKDAELVQASLQAEGLDFELTRADTQPGFLAFLRQGGFDLILADYTLPLFDGISALRIAQETCPEVPFIFVSGTMGEELAIEALKQGATDYVFKTRLSRIAPSVRRALREAEERSQRRQAEEAQQRNEVYLAEAQRLSHTGSFGWQVASGKIYCGTRSIGLQAKRCAILSATHTPGESKPRSTTTKGSFGCVCGTTERASTHRFLPKAGGPGTTACLECTNAPNWSGVNWRSGVNSILVPR